MVPSISNPVGQQFSHSISNVPRQERLQTVRNAPMRKDDGSGGQQALTNEKSGKIPFHSASQSTSDQLAEQEQQRAPYIAQDTANNVALQERTRPLKPELRLRHLRKGNTLGRQQKIKENHRPKFLQQDQSRHMLLADAEELNNSSMVNDMSKRKVVGSRVVKSSTTTKTAKSKKRPTLAMEGRGGEGVIRVFINNRLGAKAEILCSPSDTVGDFKKIAAQQLGTGAGAIRLKRQGQRAFRDAITLEDYEIGNGSCLDYEMDT